MYGKWKFGLVVALLVPSLLDASAALAIFRVRPIATTLRLQVTQRLLHPLRLLYTGPRNFKNSPAWEKVTPAKQDACEEIFDCANQLRAAQREVLRQSERFAHLNVSWGVPSEISQKLGSENPDDREAAKANLGFHFINLQARAEKPPK